jgi:nuclear GTP-binding protein
MIDCPGIVPPNQDDTDEDLLLRGSVRVENVEYPAQYIEAVLRRVQPRHLQRTYDIKDYDNGVMFLEQLCRKSGRLLKGGEADIDGAAKMVLNDWIRGKLPWFTPPPFKEGEQGGPVKGVEGREGRLGEMSKKTKRDGESVATGSVAATTDVSGAPQDETEADDDEFGGFSDDDGLELDVDEDEDDEEESGDDDDEEGGAQLDGEEASEDDEEVEEEVAAISEALAKAKKRQRTA